MNVADKLYSIRLYMKCLTTHNVNITAVQNTPHYKTQ